MHVSVHCGECVMVPFRLFCYLQALLQPEDVFFSDGSSTTTKQKQIQYLRFTQLLILYLVICSNCTM